ncbi:hypothetical protein D3C78_1558320 [compost metagenome]
MIPVKVAHPTTPAQAIVETQLHPGLGQTLAQGQGKRQAAVVIEQATHANATLGGLHQRLNHRLGASARLHQVQLQIDLFLGTGDFHQHAREELRAVDQQLEAIAFTPGKYRAAHVSAP